MHKLVDQSIRVDQIDLNAWQGEGGHRCICSLVWLAAPCSAWINSAVAGGAGCSRLCRAHTAASTQDKELVVQRGSLCHVLASFTESLSPALLTACMSFGRRTPGSCFPCRFPFTPSWGSPHQCSFAGGGCTRARRQLGSGRASLLPTTSRVQANRTLPPPRLFLLPLI